MGIISTTHPAAGESTVINNHSATAVHYRVEFVGAGWVRFVVLPGGTFEISGDQGVVNIYIEDQAPGGLSAA
jgi:hypothetical protein